MPAIGRFGIGSKNGLAGKGSTTSAAAPQDSRTHQSGSRIAGLTFFAAI
jgi:hypothetical protein